MQNVSASSGDGADRKVLVGGILRQIRLGEPNAKGLLWVSEALFAGFGIGKRRTQPSIRNMEHQKDG